MHLLPLLLKIHSIDFLHLVWSNIQYYNYNKREKLIYILKLCKFRMFLIYRKIYLIHSSKTNIIQLCKIIFRLPSYFLELKLRLDLFEISIITMN